MSEQVKLGKVIMTLGGDYNSSQAYDKLTCVYYDGSSWVSRKAVPAGVAPTAVNSAYWQKVSDRGAQGPQGQSYVDKTLVPIVNDLTTGGSSNVLAAEQGKVLDTKLTELSEEVSKKCDYMVVSNNLFNKNAVTNNKIISSKAIGTTIGFDNSATLCVLRIEVESGETYTFGGNGDIRTYALTDKNDCYVTGNIYVDQNKSQTIEVASNARYLWVSVYMDKVDVAQVNKGATKLPFDEYAVSPSLGKLDLLESTKEFIANDTPTETMVHSFEWGGIAGGSAFTEAYERIRCQIPLVQKKTNAIRVEMPQNFSIVLMAMQNNSGTLRSIATEYEFVGSDNNSSLWVVLKNDLDVLIPEYDIRNCKVYNTYSSTNPLQIDKLNQESLVQTKQSQSNKDSILLSAIKEKSEVAELREQIQFLEKSLDAAYKVGTPKDVQSITLPHSKGGLFLLNLHRRTNEGFAEKNNAYLPNAAKDFSDVCVLANGEPLAMRKIYSGNIDIVPDDRLFPVSGGLIYTAQDGIMYGSNNEYGSIVKSSNGKDWEEMQVFSDLDRPVLNLLDSQENLFVYSEGKLYKSSKPYTSKKVVLDISQYHSDAIIIPDCLVEHPVTHRLFVSTYQLAYDVHILCSDNYGETWDTCYRSTDTYQHIHQLTCDPYSTPTNIYAGCDAGGGILKSSDNGQTWVDLRVLNPKMPQATDEGITYFDVSGYRLAGGETTIVGGHSILKTWDDSLFKPVLSCGKGVYSIMKLNGILFGGLISTNQYQTTGIVISEDEGESWKTANTTSPMFENGASDGYRYASKIQDHLVFGLQSSARRLSPLRVYSGGENYYAQMIVDIPSGVSEISVESGHLASKLRPITNTNGFSDERALVRLSLNESQFIDGTSYGKIESEVGGRQLSEIVPSIQSAKDSQSAKLNIGFFYDLPNVDLSNKAFHIGFWMKSYDGINDERTLRTLGLLVAKHIPDRSFEDSGIYLTSGYMLKVGRQKIIAPSYPGWYGGAWMRVDINFTTDNKVQIYINGGTPKEVVLTDNILSNFSKDNLLCLYVPKKPSTNTSYNNEAFPAIQYFEITEGNITQDQANANFYANVYDVY